MIRKYLSMCFMLMNGSEWDGLNNTKEKWVRLCHELGANRRYLK